MPPINLSISDFLADRSDDSPAWQAAFDELRTAGGGRLLFDIPGESITRSTIILPRNTLIIFEGLGMDTCTIRAEGLSPEKPVFEWDNTITDSSDIDTIISDANNRPVERFVWRNMTIRHNNGGTAIRHEMSKEIEENACFNEPPPSPCIQAKDTNQELRNCTFSDLRLVSTLRRGFSGSDRDQPVLDIKGVKFCLFRNLIFEGIGDVKQQTAFRIRGVRNLIETISAPKKNNNPTTAILDFQSPNSVISHARTEAGSSNNANYYIHDCVNVDIQNLLSEGVKSRNIVLVKNCKNITLSNIVTGRLDEKPDELGGEELISAGLRFEDSKYCTVLGSTLSAQEKVGGKALVFDENSSHNTVLSTRIVRSRNREQVQDLGTNNKWAIIDVNSDDDGTLFLMPELPAGG